MLARAHIAAIPKRVALGQRLFSINSKYVVKPLNLPLERKGQEIVQDPLYNKGTAFTARERDRLGVRGLIPPGSFTIQQQLERVYLAFQRTGRTSVKDKLKQREHDPVAQHLYLNALQDRNETLFYRLLVEHLEEMTPIVYTPTIGYACKHYGQLFRRPRGLYFSGFEDRGDMHNVVRAWPTDNVDVIVITDGSRILGLGDLGVHGAPIPIGKLSLYVAGGGIHPTKVLPVCVDVGTNNPELLSDPLYLGMHRPRLEGEEFLAVMDEVMDSLTSRFPKALIQFEDFKTPYAEILLKRYRTQCRMFNDDVQGTGAMTLAGVLTALRLQGKQPSELTNQRIVCLGAGSAGLGVCNSLMQGMIMEGMTPEQAANNFYLVDNRGLLTKKRGSQLQYGQLAFARTEDSESGLVEGQSLQEVVDRVKPSVLLGLSGVGQTFTEGVIRSMAQHNDSPIIFPMSNPTDRAECTAEQCYQWTEGRGIFASGSPFEPIQRDGKIVYHPSQANNMFIFPGVGLGAVASRTKHVTDRMFYEASKTLAASITDECLEQRKVFPRIRDIRTVSKNIAVAVAKIAEESGLALHVPEEQSWEEYIDSLMWFPHYAPLVRV